MAADLVWEAEKLRQCPEHVYVVLYLLLSTKEEEERL